MIGAAKINLAEINDHLNHRRMHEYEDIYDNILESNTDNELDAIGHLIDDAIVKLDGDALSMKLTRLHQ